MSDATKFRRTRTVRLSAETEKQIQAVAAQKRKTVSVVIREALEAEFSTARETPGQWLLRTAKLPRARKPEGKFSSAYRQQHQSWTAVR
jgi:predicted DNA-binding protein